MGCARKLKGWINGDAEPVWPSEDDLPEEDGMTAISLVYTLPGFVMAADGLSRSFGPDIRKAERTDEQKIFKGKLNGADFAWAITGNVFNGDRSFSLISIAKDFFAKESVGSLSDWTDALTLTVSGAISQARTANVIAPLSQSVLIGDNQKAPSFARFIIAGYLREEKYPTAIILRFPHDGEKLIDPEIQIKSPPRGNEYFGSNQIAQRCFGNQPDARFSKYVIHPSSGRSFEEGIANAKGYIGACCDPEAKKIDPICEGIGGHIHIATVTPTKGFQWVPDYEPVTALAPPETVP